MKSLISSIFILICCLSILSCRKTTKGKLSNDWEVVGYEEKYITQTQNNDEYGTVQSVMENEERTSHYSTGSNQYYDDYLTATFKTYRFTINRNGSWTRNYDKTDNKGVTRTLEESGSWSFLKKNGAEEFGCNERIIFNTLSRSQTTINPVFNPAKTFSTVTYLPGEVTQVFTVVESTRKSMVLEMNHLSITEGNKVQSIVKYELKQ